jgi:hypothetical protein
VWYCSTTCQRKDWGILQYCHTCVCVEDITVSDIDPMVPSGGHKFECTSIKKIYPHSPTQTIRMMARLLRIKKAQRTAGIKDYVDFLISRTPFAIQFDTH